MNPKHMRLKEMREQSILCSLDKLGYASRYHLQVIHDLGTNSNANRVLKQMKQYLNSFTHDQKIYYLNKKGLEAIGSSKVPKQKPRNVDHTLMRNDIYLHYQQPETWMIEVPLSDIYSLTPDVIFKDHYNRYCFLEVDNEQHYKNNRDKIKRYRDLLESGSFQSKYNHDPTIIFYTKSEGRKKNLEKLLSGLNSKVFLKMDLVD
jgi:hypothetical protein